MTRTKHSEYMEWAKLHSLAPFNLATSGILNVSRSDFPSVKQLEITGSDSYGYEPLQQRIAQHTGAPIESVVAATGTSMANQLAMAGVVDPGDEVLIEQPAYGPLVDVAEYLGARVKRFERTFEDDFAIDPARIDSAVTSGTRLIVLTNLHNPSGALIPAETLRAIAEIAQRVGAYVLIDEAYLEMSFDNNAPFAFPVAESLVRNCAEDSGPYSDRAVASGVLTGSSARHNPFIVTNSLTKTYGLSGLRCGWILASAELAKRIWRLNDLFGVNAPHPAEQMSVVAFDHLDQFRDRARKLLNANRALLNAFLDSRTDLECFRPAAGTIVFPRLKHGNAERFFKLLREKYETRIVPGKFFDMPEHFRIGVGGETANVAAGLERLSAALDEVR